MKKFILFPLYFLIIGFLIISCFNNPKETTSTMLILKNVDCQDCYEEISTIIKATRGIYDLDITQSEDKSTILILIEYNPEIGDMDKIKMKLILKGYEIDSSK
tara:strand:- start:280 stop:588 length:309 start_codon:yes stop_codon:yes gene_type:complete